VSAERATDEPWSSKVLVAFMYAWWVQARVVVLVQRSTVPLSVARSMSGLPPMPVALLSSRCAPTARVFPSAERATDQPKESSAPVSVAMV
jgi:hypothetical protein